MWRRPTAAEHAGVRHRFTVAAIGAMTALGTLDAAAGRDLIILGTLSTGPGIAAGSGRPRAVLAAGGYALVLINVLSWWPDRIWGSAQHLVFNAVAAAMTAAGVALAGQIRAVERARVLAENHSRILAAVVAHSDDAIVAADLRERLIAYNTGAERLYGYPAGDVIGTPAAAFCRLVTPAEASGPDAVEVLARITGGEPGIRYESVRQHRDGTVKNVSVVASPIYDESGTLAGVSSVTRDITARKHAEERLRQGERMASLGQLAGGVAHDFNNLLGIMLSFIDFAEEASTDPEVRADLAKTRQAGERAVELTRQLLTFTRQDHAQPRDLDVNTCLTEVHAMLARTIGENIELIVKPSPGSPTIHADAGQIQQVLLNLAVNARDAMPDGGALVIEAAETALDEGQTDLRPAPAGGRYVRLLVSDTGTGMSAEVAARVFEPFYTTKPKGHGTGLGLATVYGIIAAAGGSINVYSELGIGTTFRVYFPVAARSTTAAPARAEEAPAAGNGRTVLIVEDEPALGEAVARILAGGGYRTLCAGCGSAALDLDRAEQCDLLLTDVIMPDISGRQLAETMLLRHPGLPVLYMSGYSDGLLADEHSELEFIEKPFTSVRLLSRIGTMLSSHARTGE
jgi:PAS domain S-box-containing protein